ncbi:hypothetical protein BB560_002501 [Smittium megazygosporum]|uniref:Dipeptidyl-peptidase V n=1 Tax=Smittium megazygosporum TaxID=133381 RepID=A0A2T9ZEM9_9FUNG|nr:hypothetical protein BB560_002501 [Smittium megazygosporum]
MVKFTALFFLSFSAFVISDVFKPDASSFPDWSKLSKFTPETLVQLRRINGYSVSPDSSTVVYSTYQYNKTDNASGTNLRIMKLDPSSSATDLTEAKYKQGDSGPFWIDDNTVGFSAVRGSPASNLFTVSVKDKKVTQVTNFTQDIGGIVYSPEASMIAFTSSVYQGMDIDESAKETEKRSSRPSSGVVYDKLFVRHWNVWIDDTRAQLFTAPVSFSNGVLSLTGKPVNIIAKYTGGWGLEPSVYNFSPDCKSIVFVAKIEGKEEAWSTEGGVFIAPVDGSTAPVRINSNFKGAVDSSVYSPDGKYVSWLQMATPGYESDQNQVILYEIATGKQTRLIPDVDISPIQIKFSSDSKSIFMIVPYQKDVPLFQLEIGSNEPKRITDSGSIDDFEVLGNGKLITLKSSFQFPATIYTIDPSAKTPTETKISTENDAVLKSVWMSPTYDYWFTGALNETVQALVVFPFGFDPSKVYPVATLIHGGPQLSWNDDWSYRWNPNIYTNQGYVVVIINFHGGNSYGQKFTDSIQHNWGTYPYEDIMKGLDYFFSKVEYAKEDNIVALGASYGGYMIDWINGHTNRFRALVCHDGNFNLVDSSYSTEEIWFSDHDLGIPWVPEQREWIERNNPERFVGNWETPMFVIHSQYDYRLDLSEGISEFTALQRRGIESKFLYFPDESHWVVKPPNSMFWYSEVLKWIGKYSNVTTWTLSWD